MKRTLHLAMLWLLVALVALAAVAAALFAFAIVTGGFARPGRDLFGLLLCGAVVGLAAWGMRLLPALSSGFRGEAKRRLFLYYAVIAVAVWAPWVLLGFDGSRRLQQELVPLCVLFLLPLVATAATPSEP